jgi:hypothetical protein
MFDRRPETVVVTIDDGPEDQPAHFHASTFLGVQNEPKSLSIQYDPRLRGRMSIVPWYRFAADGVEWLQA